MHVRSGTSSRFLGRANRKQLFRTEPHNHKISVFTAMEPSTKRLKLSDPGQYGQVVTGSNSSAPAPVPAGTPPGQHSDSLLSLNNLLALTKRVFQNSRLMSRPLPDPDVMDARPFAPGTNTHNDQSRQGPEIQFGEGAQEPRWLVGLLPQSQQPQQNNDQLVRDHSDLQAFENASQSNPRMAMLAWKFDAGPPSNWKNLTTEQLYEYAHKYLENSLDNPFFRDHVRLAINAGPYAAAVADVEDPLPPLPTAPLTNFFGPPLGFANTFNYGSHMYFDNRRPSTTVRKGKCDPFMFIVMNSLANSIHLPQESTGLEAFQTIES